MSDPQPSIQQHAAFGKSIGLILCAMALIVALRPSLFEPASPEGSDLVNKRLRAVWLGALHYYVDYGVFPRAGADGTPPPSLKAPVVYVSEVATDPYSSASPLLAARLDPTGRGPVRKVSLFLIAAIGARLAWIVLWRRRWRRELQSGGEEMWAAGLVLSAWLAGAYVLAPAPLRMSAMGAMLLGGFCLFAIRRLTQGSLLLLSVSACGLVFSLLTERKELHWFALGAAGLALLRTLFLYWTLTVRRSKGQLGHYQFDFFGRGFVFPFCVYLTLVSCAAMLMLGQAQLAEAEQIRTFSRGARAFAFASRDDFFAVSSNGPDLERAWRDDVLFRLFDEEGPESASDYLTRNTFDPTNGLRSPGDIILTAEIPKESGE